MPGPVPGRCGCRADQTCATVTHRLVLDPASAFIKFRVRESAYVRRIRHLYCPGQHVVEPVAFIVNECSRVGDGCVVDGAPVTAQLDGDLVD